MALLALDLDGNGLFPPFSFLRFNEMLFFIMISRG